MKKLIIILALILLPTMAIAEGTTDNSNQNNQSTTYSLNAQGDLLLITGDNNVIYLPAPTPQPEQCVAPRNTATVTSQGLITVVLTGTDVSIAGITTKYSRLVLVLRDFDVPYMEQGD